MALVHMRGVRKSYDERPVLAGVCLDAEAGDSVAIVGPSGSGKSTLLNILGALALPDAGDVLVDGRSVPELSGDEQSRYRATVVGFVLQDHHLLPQLTLLENTMLPAVAARQAGSRERAMDLLTRVGVGHRADAYPWQVSGGERQRAALARALFNRPKLLLGDEPTGNLDQATGAAIVDLLLSLAAGLESDGGRPCVLMVTHNLEHARRFSRMFRLENGRLQQA